jgi:NAD(P)-dependent dehydrogenase (short-subunit alcohol dehydrogenase family)
LAEKVVVVTNVWSGPGLATAILLSRRGFKVFGTVDEYIRTTEALASIERWKAPEYKSPQ